MSDPGHTRLIEIDSQTSTATRSAYGCGYRVAFVRNASPASTRAKAEGKQTNVLPASGRADTAADVLAPFEVQIEAAA